MDTTYVTAADLATRWHCKRDTVYAWLRAAGVAEYRFGPRSIRYVWADVLAYEADRAVVVPTTQVAAISDRPKTRGNTSGKRGPIGRWQRVAA